MSGNLKLHRYPKTSYHYAGHYKIYQKYAFEPVNLLAEVFGLVNVIIKKNEYKSQSEKCDEVVQLGFVCIWHKGFRDPSCECANEACQENAQARVVSEALFVL